MSIINYQVGQAGLSGVAPSLIYIQTNDSFATVLTTGYLNKLIEQEPVVSTLQCAMVYTKENVTDEGITEIYSIVKDGNNWSLVPFRETPNVTPQIPAIVNYIGDNYHTVKEAVDAGEDYILVLTAQEENTTDSITLQDFNLTIEIFDYWDLNVAHLDVTNPNYSITIKGISVTSQMQFFYETSKAIISGSTDNGTQIYLDNITILNSATVDNTPLCSSPCQQYIYGTTWFDFGRFGGGFRSQSSLDVFSNLVFDVDGSTAYDLFRVGSAYAENITLRGTFSNVVGQYALTSSNGSVIQGLHQTSEGGEYASCSIAGSISNCYGNSSLSDLIIDINGVGSIVSDAKFCKISVGSNSIVENIVGTITMSGTSINNIISNVAHVGDFTVQGSYNVISNILITSTNNFIVDGNNNTMHALRVGNVPAGTSHIIVSNCTSGVLSGCMSEAVTVVNPGQSITETGSALFT